MPSVGVCSVVRQRPGASVRPSSASRFITVERRERVGRRSALVASPRHPDEGRASRIGSGVRARSVTATQRPRRGRCARTAWANPGSAPPRSEREADELAIQTVRDALAADGFGVEATPTSLARWGYELYGGSFSPTRRSARWRTSSVIGTGCASWTFERVRHPRPRPRGSDCLPPLVHHAGMGGHDDLAGHDAPRGRSSRFHRRVPSLPRRLLWERRGAAFGQATETIAFGAGCGGTVTCARSPSLRARDPWRKRRKARVPSRVGPARLTGSVRR